MELEGHAFGLIDSQAPCCIGIDEAGRGPVLGPMVYGACYCAIEHKSSISKIGFADSKQLSESQRDCLFGVIRETLKENSNGSIPIGWMVEILEPEKLSMDMLKINKVNLNTISHNAAISLIRRALERKLNIKEVFVDTVGPPETYQEKLKQIFPELNITVSKKADSLFPIVSAASICAKVTRDYRLRNWKLKEHLDGLSIMKFGSGYPSDPLTKTWLRKNMDPVFGFPSVVRFSWKTTSNILQNAAVDVIWSKTDLDEFYGMQGFKSSRKRAQLEEKETKGRDCPFIKFPHRKPSKQDRYRFFSERSMELVRKF